VSSENSGTFRSSRIRLIFCDADGSRTTRTYALVSSGSASAGCAPPPASADHANSPQPATRTTATAPTTTAISPLRDVRDGGCCGGPICSQPPPADGPGAPGGG